MARELREALPAMRRGGDFVESYRAQWRAFLDGVRRGEPVGPSLAEGRQAVRVALAAPRSAATGRAVACGDGVDPA